ncbi:MAG TPA: CBS domain-containing protein [Candidatus Lokiarchaeia archaeon]|nr:CBS domain-containing protein [Candidatus Lokiarchaeia archaeon]
MSNVVDMLKGIMARDMMVTDIISIPESERIRDIELMLLKKGIGGVPVVRDGMIVGMLTQHDISVAKNTMSIGGMVAGDLMSRSLACVGEDASLVEILQMMRTRDIERIPVVDENKMLIGMIMHRDILAKILEILETES